jgi:hypothetical protein
MVCDRCSRAIQPHVLPCSGTRSLVKKWTEREVYHSRECSSVATNAFTWQGV